MDGCEADLIERFRRGDEPAFRSLVEQHKRLVYAIAYRMTFSHAAADDVSQDVFIALWDARARIDPERPLRPWLRRVAVNMAINHLRARRRQGKRLADGTAEGLPGDEPIPPARVEGAESVQAIHAAIQELPEARRAVLVLRAFEGLAYHEIAETLNCSIGTVMSRLHRARTELQEKLAAIKL